MGAIARVVEAWKSDRPGAVLRVIEGGVRWRLRRLVAGIRRLTGTPVRPPAETTKSDSTRDLPPADSRKPGPRSITSDRSIAAATARLLEFDEPARSTEEPVTPIRPNI